MGAVIVMAKADRRRAEITRAAAELFERHGYHNVSVDDLADAVGLAKAGFYHYVERKAELVVWIHDELLDPLLARLERSVADDVDPRLALRQVLADTIWFMDVRPGYLRLFFENQREIPEDLRSYAAARRKRYADLIRLLIERGIDRGLIQSSHPELTAYALLGIVNWSYQWHRPGMATPDEVSDHLFRIFLTGAATDRGATLPLPELASSLAEELRGEEMGTSCVSDNAWSVLRELLPPASGTRGRQWRDHRQVLDAIAWKVQSGAPWSDLPEIFGPWRTVYGRLARWRADGTWDRLAGCVRQDERLRQELAWILTLSG